MQYAIFAWNPLYNRWGYVNMVYIEEAVKFTQAQYPEYTIWKVIDLPSPKED